MPTLLANAGCASCGFHHDLCLPDGTLRAGHAYGYVCPRTAARVTPKPDTGGVAAHHYPPGAVRPEVVEDGRR